MRDFGTIWEELLKMLLHQPHTLKSVSPHLVGQGEFLCWTKMQAEAGQTLEAILARKERERLAGDGVFMWGVGNAPALVTNTLARLEHPVPVIFSVMKSKPKAIDAAPSQTFIWRGFIDRNGHERPLPEHVVITSRGAADGGAKKRHYALMCYADQPLTFERGLPFDHLAYRNASDAGGAIGASQVTALVRRASAPSANAQYEANLRAELVGSYWVRLTEATLMSEEKVAQLASFEEAGEDRWLALAKRLRANDRRASADLRQHLFI